MIDARQRTVAHLVACCFFMKILDETIVTAAAPRIGIALHVSSTAIGLVITSYFIAVAVLIPLGGWMAARFGTELRGVRQTRSRR
jgi:MFS family permease